MAEEYGWRDVKPKRIVIGEREDANSSDGEDSNGSDCEQDTWSRRAPSEVDGDEAEQEPHHARHDARHGVSPRCRDGIFRKDGVTPIKPESRREVRKHVDKYCRDTQWMTIVRPEQVSQLVKDAFAGMSAKSRAMLEKVGVTAATYPIPPIEVINPRKGFDVDRITQFSPWLTQVFVWETVKFLPMQSSTEIILNCKRTSVVSIALKSMWEALTNNAGVHWYTVAKVMLWDACIINHDESGEEYGCRRTLAKKFQAGGLAAALPDDDVPSTCEVGSLYQYPFRSLQFFLALIAYYVQTYYEEIGDSQLTSTLKALRLEIPMRRHNRPYDGYAQVLTQLWPDISMKADLHPSHRTFKMLRKHFMEAMRQSIDEQSFNHFDTAFTMMLWSSPDREDITVMADARPAMEEMITGTVRNMRDRGLNAFVLPRLTSGSPPHLEMIRSGAEFETLRRPIRLSPKLHGDEMSSTTSGSSMMSTMTPSSSEQCAEWVEVSDFASESAVMWAVSSRSLPAVVSTFRLHYKSQSLRKQEFERLG